jgi:hypothetical protein
VFVAPEAGEDASAEEFVLLAVASGRVRGRGTVRPLTTISSFWQLVSHEVDIGVHVSKGRRPLGQ